MANELVVGMRCIKYMLFVASVMIMMIGFLLISIGSTIKAIYGDFDLFIESHYFSPAALTVAIGVIMFFVGLFGFIAGCKESTFLVNCFSFLLTLILILEISAAIAAYAMRGDIKTTVRNRMEDSIRNYYSEYSELDRDVWDFTQDRLHCCGVNNASDWTSLAPQLAAVLPLAKNTATTLTSTTIAKTTTPDISTNPVTDSPDMWKGPSSCCSHTRLYADQCPANKVWKHGCLENLTYIISECALLLGCGTLAVTFIQILAIIFAGMLAKAIRRIKTDSLVENQQNRQRLYEQLARAGPEDKGTPVLYTTGYSEC